MWLEYVLQLLFSEHSSLPFVTAATQRSMEQFSSSSSNWHFLQVAVWANATLSAPANKTMVITMTTRPIHDPPFSPPPRRGLGAHDATAFFFVKPLVSVQ